MNARFREGFALGMMLQIAVGPVCLAVFSLGTAQGFWPAWQGAMGAVVADIIFVALALLGAGSLMSRPKVQRFFRVFGSAAVALFGLQLILGAFKISLFPSFGESSSFSQPFVQILIVTLSNPMAVLFWIGIFSVRIGEIGEGLYPFALGALAATFVFLTLVAALSGFTQTFLPLWFLDGINAAVGVALLYFAYGRWKSA